MFAKSLILIHLLISIHFVYVNAHGFLFEPIGRASAWRNHFKTPEDYDDDGLFCGGHNSFWELNFGKCGICGDAFESKQPRPHEVGGKFVTKPPTIVQTYEQGDIIDVVVNLTANHGGFFIFQLCPVDNPEKEATEDCLNDHNLEIVRKSPKINLNLIETNLNNSNSLEDLEDSKDNSYESYDSLEINNEIDFNLDTKLIKTVKRFNLFNPVDLDDHSYDKFKYNVPMESPRSYNIKVKLPNEINCKRCVFRWIYITGNTWGTNERGVGKLGNGKQEEFRNCADIRIH